MNPEPITTVAPKPAPPTPQSHVDDLLQPRRARWSLRVMAVGLLALVGWAAVGEIDQVTRAQAQIIASDRTQLVQSPDGGVLTQLHVKEGEVVKAGQLLVTLQKERAAAAVSDSSAKVAALRITLTRLHAEVYERPLVFERSLLQYGEYIRNQTDLYSKRQTAFKDDVSALENILALAEDELNINRQLEASGDVSRAEILRLQRSVADIRAQLASKRNKYFQDAQTEMTKAQEELSTQTEQLRDRSQVLEHTELVAPMDAVVNNIKINTIGGVVRAGDTVLELLPTGDNLIAEAKIPPADIAFVAIGQAQGLTYPSVKRVVKQYLGDFVTVYPHQNYADYMKVIGNCDMFMNPFPFGNTNGIVDTVSAGLVGVCKTGPEVHEHIDEGMFRRLGFPDRFITHTDDEYAKEVMRLAVMHEERERLSQQLAGPGKVDVLFKGRPHILGEMIQQALADLGW